MKFKTLLLASTLSLVAAGAVRAQVVVGDDSELTTVTSDPTEVAPPVLTPSSQVIIVGGSAPTVGPITVAPPVINTNIISPVQFSPSSVIIAGGGGSTPPPTTTNSVPVGEVTNPENSGPTVIGTQKQPVFRPALSPVRRPIQVVRPGPPLLRPVR